MTPNASPLTPHIALIGAGYWGKNLVRNFHQLGVLKTICDQSGAIRQQMAKDYPDTTVTDDFNALLSDPDILTR
jgi:UDP-2-acetamido-3-amino-2,3-dideoxy-glucuronate N-acetyltransferase